MKEKLSLFKKLNLFAILTIIILSSVMILDVLGLLPRIGVRALIRKSKPDASYLIVNKVGIDAYINQGESEDNLLLGAWLYPQGSTPDKSGNTVILSHRVMQLSGPDTFLYLDQLNFGDDIQVKWYGKEYNYKVSHILDVDASEVSVMAQTAEDTLTLITCHPIWRLDRRLVVQAIRV